eukprot:gene57666-biopygen17129
MGSDAAWIAKSVWRLIEKASHKREHVHLLLIVAPEDKPRNGADADRVVTVFNGNPSLYKYTYKGHDRAAVELGSARSRSRDEITEYLDCRYVGAPEACWRIFGTEADAVRKGKDRNTMLTAWFKLNQEDPSARHLKYSEVPEYYCWDKAACVWKQRPRDHNTVSRIYTCNPKDVDRFYLRLLLLHVPGAKSFADLRTVNGVTHADYRAAAVALGIATDDSEFHAALTEACAQTTSGSRLRDLFTTMLLFSGISQP